MQDYSSEMEFYRYLAAAAAAGGGVGAVNEMVTWAPTAVNYSYSGGFGGGGGGGGGGSGSSSSFYHHHAGGLMMSNESEEANRAIVASRIHHKEAEKRRRERINSHLDRLRSLLPCTSKTDKATLLSKVVQRVLELKRQTSELLELDSLMIPSENDEFAVFIHDNNSNPSSEEEFPDDNNNNNNDNGDNNNINIINDDRVTLRASLCCEDRPDLFSDLNGVLDSLNLKTLRAEISSLGGRVQSVLIVSADNTRQSDECAVYLRDALKGVVQRSGSEERLKRRRRVSDA